MKEIINNIKAVIPLDIFYLLIAVFSAIILLSFIRVVLRKKKARRMHIDCESKYNDIKGIPLQFKLNKADALSRVNEAMAEEVGRCRQDFDVISEQEKKISITLAEIEDEIYGHKVKQALVDMEDLKMKLNDLSQLVEKVNHALDQILEQENEQRIQINLLKDEFRLVRKAINDDRATYAQSMDFIENLISEIENHFSTFEEWMYASEFNKAEQEQIQIRGLVKQLHELVDCLPGYYNRARGVLPAAIDEVGFCYAQAKNKGVYLEKLEVHKNLDFVSDVLKDCLMRLRNGELKDLQNDLDNCERHIQQLKDQINKEDAAFDEVINHSPELFKAVKDIANRVKDIEELYYKVYTRFGFENWNDRLKEVNEKLDILLDMKRKLEANLHNQPIPYTFLLIAYKELEQSVKAFSEEVSEMKQALDTACSDEERAKKQLVRLQVLLNEIRVKMMSHRLPNVSNKYEDDLEQGQLFIKDIRVILDNSPLDVTRLNTEVQSAIDFIYTLYNNVNNLVGIAIMVEKAIVFGNQYRSYYPQIDSDLSRADLCFRNGQYTKALKISLHCIEELHPGAYEKLLSNEDTKLLKEVE